MNERTCPFCSSKMRGEEGSLVCSNVSCNSYQVDTTDRDIYDKNRRIKKVKK